MRSVRLHWKQVIFGCRIHCQNYETISFLRTFPQENNNQRHLLEKNSLWWLSSRIYISRSLLSPWSRSLVISWYCRLLYRCRHLSLLPLQTKRETTVVELFSCKPLAFVKKTLQNTKNTCNNCTLGITAGVKSQGTTVPRDTTYLLLF